MHACPQVPLLLPTLFSATKCMFLPLLLAALFNHCLISARSLLDHRKLTSAHISTLQVPRLLSALAKGNRLVLLAEESAVSNTGYNLLNTYIYVFLVLWYTRGWVAGWCCWRRSRRLVLGFFPLLW